MRQFVDMHMGDQNNAAAAQAAFVALGEVLAQIEQESGVDTANWDQWQNDAHYDPVYQRWVNMQDIFTWYHNTFD
ncbi:MAG TPA: hypothetical protein VFV67_08495 [Actinophytocola sp.]|uniref:hypothetical protein n=1 Tax=Actinophytocola sp. TaxID=1872138 RepID=UPI002DBB97E6|nr:hypothetical protein [Actinophytocola sp.]HEU5470679.1 hypothetical protein [Actinophytocola sp.]